MGGRGAGVEGLGGWWGEAALLHIRHEAHGHNWLLNGWGLGGGGEKGLRAWGRGVGVAGWG